MMRERFLSGYNDFVLPFMIGMVFILSYVMVGIIRVILQLTPEDRKKLALSLLNPKTLWKDFRDIICDCLLHVKIFKRNPRLGYMHASIAFGWFMIIVIGHIEVILFTPERLHQLYYPIFFRFFVAEAGDATLRGSLLFFLMDLFLLMILSGIAMAMFKRIRSLWLGMRRTTKPSLTDLIAMYALWAIFPLRLLAEGFTAHISGGSFLTKSVNFFFGGFFSNPDHLLPIWWAYSIALGLFLIMLPFSRYMHIPTEMFLVVLRNAGVRITHPTKGYSTAQIYSCSSCGMCLDACPMTTQKKNLPFTSVYFVRFLRRRNSRKSQAIAEKCLMCGKCEAICPVGVQSCTLKVADRSKIAYQYQHQYDYLPPVPAAPATAAAPTPAAAATPGQEKVLYYQGCMTQLTPAIARAMEKVLKTAGVDYEFLDREGGICCGRPLEVSGKLEEAKELMSRNREAILSSGATTLLLTCPICYRVFREYYDLPGIRIVHHTTYLKELLEQGRIKVNPSIEKLVYHDPCELGRGCGEYQAPRYVLAQVGQPVPAKDEGELSICCGGSVGSLTLSYEDRGHITQSALESLTVNHPDKLVTACPLCLKTFSSHSGPLPVQDLVQLVAEQLEQTEQ